MTSKQRERIEEHGRRLLAAFPHATEREPVELCRRLRRLESRGARLAESQCNGPALGDEEWDAAKEALMDKVDALLHFRAAGVPVFVNGDPRGYALKVRAEYMSAHPKIGLPRDWGGYGLIAPEITA